MNCPHCQKELPENYSSTDCPYCGENMTGNAEAGSSQNTPTRRFPWFWFFLVLAAPAILNFVLASFAANSIEVANVILGLTFAGSPAAGIAGAILFGRWKRDSSNSRINVVALAVLLSVLSFGLCFVGCAAGFTLASSQFDR
jgi:hypothetical protein